MNFLNVIHLLLFGSADVATDA